MPTNDQRTAQRRKQLKAGVITFHSRHATVPCSVREISERGARIEIDPTLVPDTFELLIEIDGLEADCEVVWRRKGMIGVRFRGEMRRRAPRRLQVVTSVRPPSRPSLRRKPVAS
jgi:hypothetical protein